MPKRLSLLTKKRRHRQSGSPRLAFLGEALFFAVLFVVGSIGLGSLFAHQGWRPTGEVSYWLSLLMSVSFLLISVGGILYTALHLNTSVERRSAIASKARSLELLAEDSLTPKQPNVPVDEHVTSSPGVKLKYRLPADITGHWALAAAALFAIVWAGFVAVLAFWAIDALRVGELEWLLFASLPVAGAISVWAFRHLWQLVLQQTAIGPTIMEISGHPLFPGQRYNIFLSQTGKLTQARLRVFLVCEEEANFHQGTNLRVETAIVREIKLHDTGYADISPSEPLEYAGVLEIPADAIHSFRANNNSIRWKLVVRGHARGWDKFERCFAVTVYPAESEAAA